MNKITDKRVFLFVSGLIAGSGGLIFGYDVGIISGAMFQLASRFDLSPIQKGLIVSLLSIGSMIGCLLGGYLSDRFGRWKTIHFQNIIFVVGFLILAFSNDVASLYVGRLVLGVASAFSAVADVPYLHEIAPPKYRGRLASMYEVMIVFGALLSSLCSLCLWDTNNGWRIMFLLPIVFAVAQSGGLLLLPDSPKWLLQHNMPEEARKALNSIYCGNTQEVDHAFQELEASTSSSHMDQQSSQSLLRAYRLPLFAIVVLMALGQLTGSVVVRNYAPTIFSHAGIGELRSLELNSIISVINLVVVMTASNYVDHAGRIAILCLGFIVAGIGMCVLAIGFLISSTSVVVFLVGGTLTSAGFNMGFGPVGWILSTELFPTKIRGRSLSVAILARNVFEFATNFLFLLTVSSIGAPGTFFLFAAFCLVALLFALFGLVESKLMEPSEILADLSRKQIWSCVSNYCRSSNDEENTVLMTNMADK